MCMQFLLFCQSKDNFSKHSPNQIFLSLQGPLKSFSTTIIYKACCWDCDDFYISKTKRRLHDRKTEHFKALAKIDNTSAVADHVKTTGHNIKWDHFEIFASGKTDYHCKISKKRCLVKNLSQLLIPTSVVRS